MTDDNGIHPPNDPFDDHDAALVARICEANDNADFNALLAVLTERHPADAADALEQLSPETLSSVVRLLATGFPPDILAELRDETRVVVLDALPDQAVEEAVRDIDSDDAAALLNDLPEDRRELILANLSAGERTGFEESLSFDEETAGRLMQREFVAAPEFWTVGQTVDHARQNGDDLPDVFFDIYVVDPAFRVVGAVALSDLLRATRDQHLRDCMRTLEVLIPPDMDQEEVAYAFQKYHLASAPVVDEAGRLTGMITVDDMVDVIQDENREDILALSGVSEELRTTDSVWSAIKSRTPWLSVNLLTAFLASGVISIFEATIDKIVALAILMPVVAALGGNAGSQSLAVTVRALTERELSGSAAGRAVRREFFTGAINGLLFAVGVAAIAMLWFRDYELALVIGIAMFATLVWAGLAGILIPLALKRMGADPAVASSVFLLTTVDVVGFLSFLGLASYILL